MRLSPRALCVLILAIGCLGREAAATEPQNFGGQSKSISLPYLNAAAPGAPMTDRPQLDLSIGGAKLKALVDTGSTGVAFSAARIPHLRSLPHLGRGELVYTGSRRVLRGRWVLAPVTVSGADGASITTRPILVLAVEALRCLPGSKSCRPRRKPDDIAMLGVGFARRTQFPDPHVNPFMSAEDMGTAEHPGAMRRGYIISRTGVQLGLNAANTAGFSFVKLGKGKAGSQWAPAPACIALDDRVPACGTMLMDTGAGVMFLRVPHAHRRRAESGRVTLPDGTRIHISVPGLPVAAYSVRVGDSADPMVPNKAVLAGPPHPAPFVNTSYHFLNGFDYLYDADGGYVGMRPLAGGAR
ncbi:hypothetical protein [Xanthobacter agilis]|uniref:hypothetical protein n=1 Tax=Xanthobacter agilis TaxID=47492 RepID=UPI0037267CAD